MNKIFEASVSLNLNGLESDDLETVSRILALAGQVDTANLGGGIPHMDSPQDDMSRVAGLFDTPIQDVTYEPEVQDVDVPVLDTDPTDFDTFDSVDDDNVLLSGIHESAILPDLSLGQDEEVLEDDASNETFGPYNSEEECILDAQQKTNGVEGLNFTIKPLNNRFYWERVVSESDESVDALTDVVNENSIEELHESLMKEYKNFIKNKDVK